MNVREAERGDIGDIRRVAHESWEADYPEIMTRETIDESVDEWYSVKRLEEGIDSSDALLLVAESDGGVVGFSHSVWTDEEGDILRLYVTPEHRRAGVGTLLLERTRDELLDHGVDRIVAMVLAANDEGNAFYEAFGFERVDEGETIIGGEAYPENVYRLASG